MTTQLVQEYPKTSSNCVSCKSNLYNFNNNGFPTNMSVRNNNFPKYSECYNEKVFKGQLEPKIDNDYYSFLNPTTIQKSFDPTYTVLPAATTASYSDDVYTANDPRLLSIPLGGQVLALDRPPINGAIPLDKIYTDPVMSEYGKKYNTYTDVNAGQIVYYIDHSLQDAFFKPLFDNTSEVQGTLYKDPMGTLKPHYNRIPLVKTNVMNTRQNGSNNLTWIRDSQEYREDIMSKQMAQRNQQKYSTRWTGNISF